MGGTAVEPRADRKPRIGLAIIARNEETTLPRLLDSVGFTELSPPAERPLVRDDAAVDYVVVADGGSTDLTRETAAARGCEVVSYEGDGGKPLTNYSKQRQLSYDALPDGLDFTLWADCDDVLEGAEKLRDLALNMPPQMGGLIFRYDYARDHHGNCLCNLWRERLVRKGIGEHWVLPIHECLRVDAPLAQNGDVVWVHHREDAGQDPRRNYKVLLRDYQETRDKGLPPDPRSLIYLGTESLALDRPHEAIAWLKRYLAQATWDEEACQGAHKLSIAYRRLERFDDAVEAAQKAIGYRPDWADGYLDLAEIALHRNESERALRFIDQAESCGAPQTMLIINPLEYAYQPVLMRSVALAKLGRAEEAWGATQKALAMTPDREDLHGQAAMVFSELKAAEAERHFLALRELLVRHDENAKAAKLMECVPYFVRHRAAVAQARLDQREMTLHSTDPEVYRRYYRDNPGESPFEEQGVLPEDAHEFFHRVDFLRCGLAEQAAERGVAADELRILDLSGNDGWMAANLSDAGYACDMMDLNAGAIERANDRREMHPLIGRIVCGNLFDAPDHFQTASYDAVVCFETIEHVPDPDAMLAVMDEMCRDDGRCYISTPDGAYERGNLDGWATVEQKGHLRAMTPTDVAALIGRRGVVEAMELKQGLIAATYRPEIPRGTIHFFAGLAEAQPEKILMEGLGGSETALCKMAELFARKGYNVRVFTGPPSAQIGLRGDHITVGERRVERNNVLYDVAAEWEPGEHCDLFVSVRVPEVFDRTINSERRVLWLHDADYQDRLTAERIERTTDVFVLSDYQQGLLEGMYPALKGRTTISRNGIERSLFDPDREIIFDEKPATLAALDKKPWVVYSSSPDRGLDVLLECWPEIKRRVPAAELHHTYAPIYHQFKDAYPHLQVFHARLEELARDLDGVVSHGHMGQGDLATLYWQSRCWAYPSWASPFHIPFPEISCISAMEAQAARAVPVCLDFAALKETVVSGVRVHLDIEQEPSPRLSDRWRESFIDAVERALTDDDWQVMEGEAGREHALTLGWDGVADEWERVLLGGGIPPELHGKHGVVNIPVG